MLSSLYKRICLNGSSRLLSKYFFLETSQAASLHTKNKVTSEVKEYVDHDEIQQYFLDREKVVLRTVREYTHKLNEYESQMNMRKDIFEKAKRHLANIMGVDVMTMTQADVDAYIKYLFPNTNYNPRARPQLKPPEELYPMVESAKFDQNGRPFHTLFYTGKPDFYEIIQNVGVKKTYLDDRMYNDGLQADPEKNLDDLLGSQWKTKRSLQRKLNLKLQDYEYDLFRNCMDELVDHPLSYLILDFIQEYREPVSEGYYETLPLICTDENGRQYCSEEGRRKKRIVQVTVYAEGTGKININETDILYFPRYADRSQVMSPLNATNMLRKVDVMVHCPDGMRSSSEAGAIRNGLSRALLPFVSVKAREAMRIAGFLMADRRKCERKKPGRYKARKRHPYRKR